MDVQNLVDAQIFTERVLHNRKLFLSTYCLNTCQLPKTKDTYINFKPQISNSEKYCIGTCLQKVTKAFNYLTQLDAYNKYNFEAAHSVEKIQSRLDRPNLDYGKYTFN